MKNKKLNVVQQRDFVFFSLIPKDKHSSTKYNIKNNCLRPELDPLNSVPDKPSTLSTGHSLSVLLLGLLLSFHNSIVLLAFYKPEAHQGKIFISIHTPN